MMRATAVIGLALLVPSCTPDGPASGEDPLVLELYPVQDLSCHIGDMGGCGGEDDALADGTPSCKRFEGQVRDAIAPGKWDRDDWSLHVQNGLLIVRASARTHEEITAYLAWRRLGSPSRTHQDSQ